MQQPQVQYLQNQNEAAFNPRLAPSSTKRGRELTRTLRDATVSRSRSFSRSASTRKAQPAVKIKVRIAPGRG